MYVRTGSSSVCTAIAVVYVQLVVVCKSPGNQQ